MSKYDRAAIKVCWGLFLICLLYLFADQVMTYLGLPTFLLGPWPPQLVIPALV